MPRLKNFAVAVKEWNDEIIFVEQVTPGASERSFGIQVARLAGLPDQVVTGQSKSSALLKMDKESQHKSDISDKEKEQTQIRLKKKYQLYRAQEGVTVRQKAVDPSQLELF